MTPAPWWLTLLLALGLGLAGGAWLRGVADRRAAARRRAAGARCAPVTPAGLEPRRRQRERCAAFRSAACELVEALADGGGRWASFYVTRDLLQDVKATGPADLAEAAGQLCGVIQRMLNDGFDDALSVRFTQALARFDAELDTVLGERGSDPGTASPVRDAAPLASDAPDAVPRRRYFSELR